MPMEVLFTTRFKTPLGSLRIVSSEKGLVYIELPNESGRGFEGWKKTHAHDAKVLDRRAAHDGVIDQLMEFMSGERCEFTMDLDMRATDFQLAVYQQVGKIGYGETVSYSDIANAIDKPKAVRAVGAANGANPIPLVIPCHRVIARGGALQGYAGGLELKARLLAMESGHSDPSPAQKRLF
ncbi:MAG: methylated-DNA--[protein]-cysteine S-methyltransferase [Myxococcales bacterium]|nr:methylated-DNA--[protein]-cysteine S-methyltransferase [Myxococcales bacterium]HIK85771.1 methylated-DNA--[protein]-cysteine S-methyltransferase [Myxococcales bacterium]